MNTILRTPDLSRYNISEHLGFHKEANAISNKYFAESREAIKALLTQRLVDPEVLVANHGAAVKQEEEVYRWMRKSLYTTKKAETDIVRDGTVKNIDSIVHTNLKHFDPALRDHAIHVKSLLDVYGNVTKAEYNAETAAIDNLTARLRAADFQASVTALGLGSLITQLETINALFKTYVDDTAQENITKPAIEPREARLQSDEALRRVTDFVVAVMVMIGSVSGTLAGFVPEYNDLVTRYNDAVHEHYGRLHARTDLTPAVLDVISPQRYTGEPVYVIPKLTLTVEREGKQEVLYPQFSVDFTVAYRNNVGPGSATLLVKGIGKFTGEITHTFDIVNQA
jgi:hypothetical protein